MSKFRYINIKISTQFVVIALMIIKFSNLFRRNYIYMSSIFEVYALKSAIQKIVIVNFSLIIFKILIEIIIFMPLNAIAAITIMNIVAIHFSHTRYQPLLSNINTLKRPLRALQSIAYMHAYAYAIRNISFNRKIHPHIYSSIICYSIFGVHLIC